MEAQAGDKLVVKGHRVGDHDRIGTIHEVRGDQGSAPYVVEWDDQPGEHVIWPGSDAAIEHVVAEVQSERPAPS
ncbi:MAG: DUF1918 domain-containing protein [Acidimicrobiales bacterium]